MRKLVLTIGIAAALGAATALTGCNDESSGGAMSVKLAA